MIFNLNEYRKVLVIFAVKNHFGLNEILVSLYESFVKDDNFYYITIQFNNKSKFIAFHVN